MKSTASLQQETFRDVKRVCYAGLDSVALRQELARRVAPAVPVEAHSFSTTDPDTGLLTHAVAEGIPPGLVRQYIERWYPYEDAVEMFDLARSGQTVVTSRSDDFWEILRAEGMGHEVNALLFADGGLWGSWCMLREVGSAEFGERERKFLQRIAPHVTRGLKAAALREMALAPEPEAGRAAVGVVVFDGRLNVQMRNAAAAEQLEDLADVGVTMHRVPYAVASVLIRLHKRRLRPPVGGEEEPADAELRVRGRSGRWYMLRASLAEPDALGHTSRIVLIEPLGPREVAPILTRLYGLSPREREVVALMARGESSKRIAARLRLSVYTVQDHLDRACEKVGVRGRKALLAKLFFDGYAPRLEG